MRRRAWIAVGILVLWLGGLGVLLKRELFRPAQDRVTEASLRVNPGVMYYAVMRDGQHVGYASSTIDTMPDSLRVTDYLVADIPVRSGTQRVLAQTEVQLSRRLRLRSFTVALNGRNVQLNAEGAMEGDSVMVVVSRRAAGTPPDTQRIAVDSGVVLPSVVPLMAALLERPMVGRRIPMKVFDPVSLSQRDVTVRLAAETTFVVPDSAVLDPATSRWRGELPIDTRAWYLDTDIDSQLEGWVDAQGRMVRAKHFDALTLERMPHEMAFENWRSDSRRRASALPPPAVPAPTSRATPAPR